MASADTELPNSWASGSLWCMTGRVQVVTFIGAGGKTTCLRTLTEEINAAGQRVIATTTTKVFPEESMKGWENIAPPPFEQDGACFWYLKVEDKSGKWMGPPVQTVDAAIASSRTNLDIGTIRELPVHEGLGVGTINELPVHGSASARTVPNLHDRYWVIEGDGARRLKLKCWEPHEPQIPQQSDCIVLVLDGGLWGNVLQEEHVHRTDRCPDLLGHVWNAEMAWNYFLRSPVFAPQYGQMSWVILLNCHGENAGNALGALLDLNQRWGGIQRESKDLKDLPNHLRIAAGDAKEGELQWFDLW
ncbi:putative selenium-dependent hydroxylase accessory protein YqeC [Desulfosporosinus fructosivorans]|uniref:Putative selenium-dependent hydroxylase accessory protein YqeC n=1 Tax=Desulfosporosinus fructosivorans TaxID=2018669 RepID=A0A4Z0R3I4_9FIRM|nr:putative selenium-dependent hydroxylase accessory protein YqeC [Desulfosporosinus fructosivorans]TGE36196.1 putative selenium-dependent hydroxylase accessory protein YqeC [Desulfosporosinus fructosivorans]